MARRSTLLLHFPPFSTKEQYATNLLVIALFVVAELGVLRHPLAAHLVPANHLNGENSYGEENKQEQEG